MAVRLAPLVVVGALALALGGCGLTDDGDNMANGKQQFVQKCGACHALARAGTTGVSGPNLDAAFERARAEGFGESTFRGIVHGQILNPSSSNQIDPKTGQTLPAMPADIVTGEDAEDVAGYVASVAGKPGEDTGRLADIGAKQAEGTARAENGVLELPADPGGALAFSAKTAEAPPGDLTIRSQNDSAIPHNIALEGNGVDEVGDVVQGGGVSEIESTVDTGEYTFYCSVPGHREGGMEGTLTVK